MPTYKKYTDSELWNLAKDNNPNIRHNLTISLRQKRATKNNINIILFLLNDRDWLVRVGALEALLDIGNKSHYKKALKLLNDKERMVRISAIECVSQLGGKEAIKNIVKLLDDKNATVRSFAATYIGLYGGRKFKEVLEIKFRIERSLFAKIGLIGGLIRFGRKELMPELEKAVKSRNYKIRSAAAYTFVDIVNKRNKNYIKKILSDSYKQEPTIFVKSVFKECLQSISKK